MRQEIPHQEVKEAEGGPEEFGGGHLDQGRC